MSTKAFERFLDNMRFARSMITSGRALEKAQQAQLNLGELSEADPGDMYRAAWVQAVAGLDHWLHEEIYDRVPKLVSNANQRRPDKLRKLSIPLEQIDEFQHRGKQLRIVVREVLEQEIGRDSYHQPDRINDGVRLVVHKTPAQIWGEVAVVVADRLGESEDWNAARVKQRQQGVVWRRNKIAHEADLDRKTGRRRPITADDATNAVSWTEHLGYALLSVLGTS